MTHCPDPAKDATEIETVGQARRTCSDRDPGHCDRPLACGDGILGRRGQRRVRNGQVGRSN